MDFTNNFYLTFFLFTERHQFRNLPEVYKSGRCRSEYMDRNDVLAKASEIPKIFKTSSYKGLYFKFVFNHVAT